MAKPTKFSALQMGRFPRLLLFCALLFMMWCGYQLAFFENGYLRDKVTNLQTTINNLNAENHALTKTLNQLQAEQAICATEVELARQAVTQQKQSTASCEQQVDFYQHVMAPELSQKMLSIDLMAVTPVDENDNLFIIEIVLLQPRIQKAVINGTLDISIKLEGSNALFPLAEIAYRFKFFQQLQRQVNIPENQVPLALVFRSDVVQYNRVRETLYQEVLWPFTQTSEE